MTRPSCLKEQCRSPTACSAFDYCRELNMRTCASWVVREKATGTVLFETFNRRVVEALNTAKYEAVPIGEYLAEINRKIRESGAT